MLLSALFWCLLALASLGAAQTTTTTATTTTPSSANGGSQFVRSQNGQFFLGDQPFQYIGTSAYWLQLIDNDDDMNKTLSEIASRGIRVVKTWAFNDVTEIPEEGVWIRVFHSNGTIEINTGPNGILRLDRIVRVAKSVGIHILFSLTNNWFPNVADAGGVARRDLNGNALPRNYLSNDFGGMDTYVKHFFPNITVNDLAHDQFYTNTQILNAYRDYAAFIVGRYKEETSVLGWEAANDPRCNSTLPARSICQPQTITQWTSDSANHIKENDPNHLVATGDSGYYCVDCVKVFPVTQPPPPQTSPLPGQKRRRWTGPLTRAKLIAKDDAWKKRNLPDTHTLHRKSGGIGIRGKWFAPKDAGVRKRQSNSFGPLYDGTFGVDTEDLLNAPGVDFSSFQYFPDQNTYAPLTTSSVSNFSELVQSGIDWIEQHAETANTFGKPATLNGFGLVTNQNSNTYAPFNSSVVQQSGVGTTSQQQVSAYQSWINAAIDANVQGIIHYQWGQTGLTQRSSPALSNQSGVGQVNSTTSTFSPNDGYAAYDDGVKGTLQAGAARIANNAVRNR